MKTKLFTCSITAAFLLAVLPTTGCAEKEKDKMTEDPLPLTKDRSKVTLAPAAVASDDTSAQWTSLKGLTYDKRVLFFAGVKQLEARVDDQIASLMSKRAVMVENTVSTADWDFAMQEMHNAQTYLRGMIEEAGKATRENWSQHQDKVGLAWVRTQDAYGKVKASTTQ